MNGDIQIVRLGPEDAVRYVYLRQSMLAHDWRRTGSLHGLETVTPSSVRGILADTRSATFAAEIGPGPYAELGSVATLMTTTHVRFAHRARLVSVFTVERHRGRGLAAAVVSAAVGFARRWPGVDFVDLCVSDDATAAQRLYERLGFVQWGRQPEAADYRGRRIDDIHMTLRLNGAR